MTNLLKILHEKEMALIASLPKNDYSLAEAAWEGGADAIKVHINVAHRASGTNFGSYEEERQTLQKIVTDSPVPVGIVLGTDSTDILRDLPLVSNSGFDFLSLYIHHCPSSLLTMNHKLCKMLACDYTYDIEEIKELKDLKVDILEASIVHPELYGTALNVRDILTYKRLVIESNLPVIVPSQKKITPMDIPILKEIGVKGIMLGAIVTGKDSESMKNTMEMFKTEILKRS